MLILSGICFGVSCMFAKDCIKIDSNDDPDCLNCPQHSKMSKNSPGMRETQLILFYLLENQEIARQRIQVRKEFKGYIVRNQTIAYKRETDIIICRFLMISGSYVEHKIELTGSGNCLNHVLMDNYLH